MLKHLKKISEEIIHQNPWWLYKHDKYEKANGEVGDYYYAETPGLAMVVPVMPDGRIALVLQHRYLGGKQSIEFPGGGIKPGQEPLDAAKAELLEETGCVSDDFMNVGSFEPSNGLIKDRCFVFIAYVDKQGEKNPDDTEEMEMLYRLPHEIDEMIRTNEIWCGETMATWALVHHRFLHEN